MAHVQPPSSDHPSHTTEAILHAAHPVRTYLMVFGALGVLLIVTVLATYLPTSEPWSFLIALVIAAIKAVLVILFFMHVKDASRVTWLFCGCSFLWLAIMLALTFGDYLTRPRGESGVTPDEGATPAAHVEGAH